MIAIKIVGSLCLLFLGKRFFFGNSPVVKDAEAQANEYQPVQSASEIAAGHPIVGAI